jgi:hypothetical protein
MELPHQTKSLIQLIPLLSYAALVRNLNAQRTLDLCQHDASRNGNAHAVARTAMVRRSADAAGGSIRTPPDSGSVLQLAFFTCHR